MNLLPSDPLPELRAYPAPGHGKRAQVRRGVPARLGPPGATVPTVTGDREGSLAEEMRSLIEVAVAGGHDEDRLASAAERVREARRLLDGPTRPRWYDVDDPSDPDSVAVVAAYAAQSPFRGTDNALAPPLVVGRVDGSDGPVIEGRVRLGRAYEGPPNGVHGGVVAGLFDDLLGAAQRLSGRRGVTGRLTVRYRALTPVETELVLRASVDETTGRRTLCRATCHAGETLTAEAEALFIQVDFDRYRGDER